MKIDSRHFYISHAISLVFFTILIYFADSYYFIFPISDYSMLSVLLEKIDNQTIDFTDYFVRHVAHFHSFSRMMMVGIAYFTQWDTWYQIVFNLGISLVGYLIIIQSMREWLLAKRNASKYKNKIIYLLVIPIISFFYFSLDQSVIWLNGWHLNIISTQAYLFACLYVLTFRQLNNKNLILALTCAVIASYNFSTGLVIWPIALFLIAFNYYYSANKKQNTILVRAAIIWLICAAITIIHFYTQIYTTHSFQANYSILEIVEKTLYAIERSLVVKKSSNYFFAAILIPFWISLLWQFRKEIGKKGLQFHISLFLSSLGAAIMLAHSRESIHIRYSSLTMPFWISFFSILILSIVYSNTQKAKIALCALLLLLLYFKTNHYIETPKQWIAYSKENFDYGMDLRNNFPYNTPKYEQYFAATPPITSGKIKRFSFMKEKKLNVFKDDF